MDTSSKLKPKNFIVGLRVVGILFFLLLIALFASIACFGGTADGSISTAPKTSALPRALRPETPLDKGAASALARDLKASLSKSIGNDEVVAAVSARWDTNSLAGKTRDQILAILFADVKFAVKDQKTLDKIWTGWKEIGKETKPDNSDVRSETQPIKPVATPTPTPLQPAIRPATIRDDDMIDLGEPPLSDADMEKIMKWIGARTAALRLPFCWKLFENRPNNDLGVPMTCKAGYNQDTNGLCYKNCAAGERGIATFCYKNCPAGLTDNGLYCLRQGEYARGGGYVIWQEANCKKDNPQGCEKSGAMWYPKCKAGYAPFGCCLCKPACPQGWENIGVSCKKPNYAREVLPLSECPSGREKSGLLCYPPCTKPGYEGVMNSCFQKCGMGRPHDCGGACTTDQKECAIGVVKQVVSIPMAIISFLTLGEASLVFAPAKAAQVAASATRLASMMAKVKEALMAAKGSIEALAGGAENLQKLGNAVKIGGKLFTAGSAIGHQVDTFSKEFANNFDAWTSPEIAKEIDQRFGKDAAFQIKRKWGLRHLTMMLKADGLESAKNAVAVVSAVDVTGVMSIVDAFMHPTCTTDTGFPRVTPLYNH